MQRWVGVAGLVVARADDDGGRRRSREDIDRRSRGSSGERCCGWPRARRGSIEADATASDVDGVDRQRDEIDRSLDQLDRIRGEDGEARRRVEIDRATTRAARRLPRRPGDRRRRRLARLGLNPADRPLERTPR
jgi:hypothetical protein